MPLSQHASLVEDDDVATWYQTAKAYSMLDNEPMANLSTAELWYNAGDMRKAIVFANAKLPDEIVTRLASTSAQATQVSQSAAISSDARYVALATTAGDLVARGALRFFGFMAVTAAAGALAHLVTHEHAVAPMIGASASVSGAMAAAMRFAFVKGSFLSFGRSDADAAARVPALSLWQALRNGRVLAFLAVWFGVNIIFGISSFAIGLGEGQSVAWQAHIGGFLAGLLLFALFDPVPRVRNDDAADASSQDISNGI